MIKLAFIGGGINSAVGRAHYCASRMDGRFEVVAGCFSRDYPTNEKTAQQYGVKETRAFPSSEQLLGWAAENDAVVVVLTPTPDHHRVVLPCMVSGIPTICEKALGVTATETAQIAVACATSKAFLGVTFNYTGYPMIRELRELIRSGQLGVITSVHAEMPQEGYLRDSANPQFWRREDGIIPAVHLDLGTHLHHLIWFLTGASPKKLVAHHASYGQFGVIDNVTALAEYDAGFSAAIWFGKTALGARNGLRIRVHGTEGSADWTQTNPEELLLFNRTGDRFIVDRANSACVVASLPRYQRFKAGHPQGFIEAYANLYTDFADALEDGKVRHEYSAEIAHEGLLMMHNMVTSVRAKAWI